MLTHFYFPATKATWCLRGIVLYVEESLVPWTWCVSCTNTLMHGINSTPSTPYSGCGAMVHLCFAHGGSPQFWHFFLDSNFTGQSMCMGGATALAEAGAVPDLIMGSGQWTSVAWTSYVWKNPVLLHALLLACTTHFQPLAFA